MIATIRRSAQLVQRNTFVCSIRSFLAEIPLEQLRLCLSEVYENQSIERVGELRVHVEAQQLAAEPQILAQEHRDTSRLLFDIAKDRAEVLYVHPGRRQAGIGKGAAERSSSADHVGP